MNGYGELISAKVIPFVTRLNESESELSASMINLTMVKVLQCMHRYMSSSIHTLRYTMLLPSRDSISRVYAQNAVVESTSMVGTIDAMNLRNTTK